MTGHKLRESERWKRRRRPQPPAPVVIMLAPTALVPSPPSIPAPLSAADRARIRKWISDRLVAASPGLCWHCRKPFAFGHRFVDIRGAETTVRFHTACHEEWLAKQEALARKALGC
jgi:hypothetical protein